MAVTTATIAGSPERAPPAGAISLPHFLLIGAQLGLLLVLLRQFQIESAAFLRLAALAFAGFAIHAWLPLRYRLPFFVSLSLAGIGVVMGLANSCWLIGLGLVLIGICHVPIPFVWRGALLVLTAAILVAQRAALLPFPWSEAIWPILGSMFMFRLVVYFYDLRHDRVPGTPVQALAYFFMLPNACFPLFPVVDYKAFRRGHFDDDAYRVYQVGVDWMVRGVIHLILYRVIYYYFTMAPAEVVTPAHLSQYLIANFLLYLRVSGLFHLIIGMLYLFGFRLPETHNRYLLAASFTDFWRRINIYWKDFMLKIFYYPAVFKLKPLGATPALAVATLYVFVMTWLLHAWQWFWLRGSVLFVIQDILFWTILGGLVVVNSLYELEHGRARSLAPPARTAGTLARTILKTYATFWFICVLWSFWTIETLPQWWSLWGALGGDYTWDVLLWPGLALLVIAVGSIPRDSPRNVKLSTVTDTAWWRERLVTIVALLALITVSLQNLTIHLGTEATTFLQSLRSGHLSRLDVAKLEQGYYENLLSVDRFNSQLWEVYSKKPANWLDVESANLKRFVGGFLQTELIPSFVSRTKYGTVSINQWGMRDQDYAKERAPGTYRAAVLGASSVMGWGVDDGRTFEALIETRLNGEPEAAGFGRYELLNFGVPGYQPPQQLPVLEKALSFTPDAVIFIAAGREGGRSVSYLTEVVKKDIDIPYPALASIVKRAGVRPDMAEVEITKALNPLRQEIIDTVYAEVASAIRASGATPVWVLLPQVRDGPWREETPEAVAAAEAAGFVIINLDDIYQDLDITTIRLAEWDDHPNTAGHELIARRLYDEMMARKADVFRPRSAAVD